MVKRALVVLGAVLASTFVVVACSDDGNHFPIGDPQADAKVFKDAAVDAHAYLDAAPVRSCVNSDAFLSAGAEHLTLDVVCESLADEVLNHATVAGGSGSGSATQDVVFTLTCLPNGQVAHNFPASFTTTQILLATKLTATGFVIPCTNGPGV